MTLRLALPLVLAAAALAAPPPRKAPARPAPPRPSAQRAPKAPAPAAAKAPVAPQADRAPVADTAIRGPLNVPLLAAERRLTLTHSPLAPGADGGEAFDGNRHTATRAREAAAFWQVALDKPRPVETCDVVFPEGQAHHWALFAAQSEADMARRAGTFVALSAARPARHGDRDQVVFVKPPAYRVYRLELRAPAEEAAAALSEWALWTPQQVARIDLETFAPTVVPGERIQLRATAVLDLGAELNVTPEARWEVTPPAGGRIDELQRFEAREPGAARVTAAYGGLRSAPLAVEVLPAGQPDWTVTYIELQPRGVRPQPGQLVYWFAHVKNYGTANAEPVRYEWRVNGEIMSEGTLPKVERFQQTDVVISSRWQPGRQLLELAVDPANEVAEVSEANNRLQVHSDALPVGFWVEDGLVRHFHRHQRELGVGANSWEDWAQRQVAGWNRFMEGGRWLWSGPEVAARRYRLDRVVAVGDGMLPLAPGHPRTAPDPRDETVRLAVGFRWSTRAAYQRTREAAADNPFFQQGDLLWELARSRTGTNPTAE